MKGDLLPWFIQCGLDSSAADLCISELISQSLSRVPWPSEARQESREVLGKFGIDSTLMSWEDGSSHERFSCSDGSKTCFGLRPLYICAILWKLLFLMRVSLPILLCSSWEEPHRHTLGNSSWQF